MVENGKFSIVLVTDSMPDQSPENTGDLIVEVDGKSLKTLKPEELNLIVQRFQSNTDHPQSVKVQKRKLTGKHMYMNMVQKHPTSNKKTTEKKTPGEELRTSEKKLWKGPLEHYEVKKKNGQFGLKLMKIKVRACGGIDYPVYATSSLCVFVVHWSYDSSGKLV